MAWLELIGVAAFAITGAMAAIEKGSDIFGVIFLAVITALGGGIIRDLLLGNTPPAMFTSYIYVAAAVIVALLIFVTAYRRRELYFKYRDRVDKVVNIFDALGLSVFTVSGVNLAASGYGLSNPLLLCLMGMCTGIGGGMLRDVLIGRMPVVLIKRIYAVASLSGALVYYLFCLSPMNNELGAVLAALLIFTLRILATVYQWNLPRIKSE